MDKLVKFLKKQSKKKRREILKLLDKVLTGDFENCNVIKLKGYKHLYRLKSGRIRIIFTKINSEIIVQKVSFRDDKTYNVCEK